MFKIIRQTFHFMTEEMISVLKNRDILFLIFIGTLAYSFLYGLIYERKVAGEMPVVLVNLDRGAVSTLLADQIEATPELHVIAETPSFSAAREMIIRDQAYGIIYIPDDFQRKLFKGMSATIRVFGNMGFFLAGNKINIAVNTVAATLGAGVEFKHLVSKGVGTAQAEKWVNPVPMMETVAFNEDMSYAEFLIPAIIALIIHQMMLMTMGIRLGEINMKGEWEDLLKRSGDSPTVLIWGIRTVQGLLFGGQLFLIYLLIPLVYGYHFDILNPWVLTGMAVFIISLGSMGMVIGSFIRRPERAVMLIAPFSVVLFILSGWSWPLEAMPWSVRWIALLLPSTPYLQLFQKAVMYHADASAVMPHLLHLVVLSVIWYWVAHYFFRKLIMKFHTERTKDKR